MYIERNTTTIGNFIPWMETNLNQVACPFAPLVHNVSTPERAQIHPRFHSGDEQWFDSQAVGRCASWFAPKPHAIMPQLNAALIIPQQARASYSELKWRTGRLEQEVYPSGFDIQLWMIGRETRYMRVNRASKVMLLQDPVGLNWTRMCGPICPNISLRRYAISTHSISKGLVSGMYYILCGIYGRKSSRYHPCFTMLLVAASALKKQRRNWVLKFKWNWTIFKILDSGHLNSMGRYGNALLIYLNFMKNM